MKINFGEIKLCDIDGKIVKETNFYKTIANITYLNAKNLDLVEIARKINKGGVVEIGEGQLKEIRQLINDPKNAVFAYARKAANDFIDSNLEKKENK